MAKKTDLAFLPPPEYFRKKKILKTLNFAQWKAQSLLKYLPPKDKVEDVKFEDLDDFTSLLTKRLFENLDEADNHQGSYTVKDGNFCLIIQQEKADKKKDDLTNRDLDKKAKHFEEMLPGPCFGLSRLEGDKKGTFNKEEILKFELMYKDVLYDTHIRVGRFYQATIPEVRSSKAFLKSRIVYGLPPKNSLLLKPPKITIEYSKVKGRRSEKVTQNSASKPEETIESIEKPKDDQKNKGSYIFDDEFRGEMIVENLYVP